MSTGIFGLLMQPPAPEARTHLWQGASGHWWRTTVHPLVGQHLDVPSVYIMVRRDGNGVAHPLYIGQTSDTGRRMREHFEGKLWAAIVMGGTELHCSYAAGSEDDRFAIETDLRNAHDAPLDRQSSAAGLGGLFGLGAAYAEKPKQTFGGLLAGY